MTDLRPEDLALLEEARGGSEPTAGDRARVQRRLVAHLGGAAFGLTAATTSTVAAGAGTAASGLTVTKIVVAVAIVTGVGAGGVVAYRETRPVNLASPAPHESAPALASAPAPAPASAPASASAQVPEAEVGPEAASASASAQKTAPTASAPKSTLDEEMKLLGEADAALRSGDGARALALLDEHTKRYPRSGVAQERYVERILALCAAGRAGEARSAADVFLRAHPSSPYAARVRASCAGRTLERSERPPADGTGGGAGGSDGGTR